jgi:hypothetical protein
MEEVEKNNQIKDPIVPQFPQKLPLKLKKKTHGSPQLDLQSSNTLDKIFSFEIPEYARDIIELEARKSLFIDAFRKMKHFIAINSKISNFFSSDEMTEDQFTYDILPITLNSLKIAAVDGSFVRKCYTNFEFSLFRAISVVYSFSKQGIDISYYPEENGIQNYRLSRILNNISDSLTKSQVSIDRAFMEVSLVNELIMNCNKNLDMIILDGSILTEPLNLLSDFAQHEELMLKYSDLVREYKKLYNLCDLQKIDLVGVVKDTRSSTFRKLLSRRIPQILMKICDPKLMQIDYKKLLPYFSDIDLFHRMLDINERSCVFSISSSNNSWIPRQLDLLNSELDSQKKFLSDYKFYACYMKPVQYDFPIRVEFHQNTKNSKPELLQSKIQRICERLLPLCSKFENFAVPIPQIEAHLRAKLSLLDLNKVIQYLSQQINEELKNFSKKRIFGEHNELAFSNFDEFLIKNSFLVPKRRERMPL